MRAGSRSATGPMISSIRRITSALNRTPAAFTFSFTCSGREAPMMAEETFGFCSTHATASYASDRPTPSATGLSCCTRVSTSSRRKRWT